MGKIVLVPSNGIERKRENLLVHLVFYRGLKIILENAKANRGKTKRELNENEDFYVRVSPLDFDPDYNPAGRRTNPLSFVSAETSIVYLTENKPRGIEGDYARHFLTASCVDSPGGDRDEGLVMSLKLGVKDCAFNIMKEKAFNANYSGILLYQVEKDTGAKDPGKPSLCAADFNKYDSRLRRKADEARIRDERCGSPVDLDRALGAEFIENLREKGYKL